ncbi:NADH-quinone oxidoreductase subunit K [Microvirga guangxiensis]|uniref:Multicomponent Na+:H+ antiporter subunit C n=1 Tax=Microvirga guangxiensis TaxID=549386 RepID=A0A1G5KDQ4_9HYPH|nr:NADH-quinone oxidoreductase subunit K [Microvirga guangxiensis]SCY98119.1 multicomponent Na+:H+ antiporter subunit C [Microvirga guangxiensis]
MTISTSLGHLFPLTGAALVGLGLFGFISLRHPLRQLLAVNVIGAGIFLILGGLGRGEGVTDPYPQALVITGIVVSVALTAVGAAMITRLAEERRAAGTASDQPKDQGP